MRDYSQIPGIAEFSRGARVQWALAAMGPFVLFALAAAFVTHFVLQGVAPHLLPVAVGGATFTLGSIWNYRMERRAACALRIQFARAWVLAGNGAAQQDARWASLLQQGWSLLAGRYAQLCSTNRPTAGHNWHSPGQDDGQPAVNIDGTPMVGSVDIRGNPYGVTFNPGTDSFTAHGGSYRSPFDS